MSMKKNQIIAKNNGFSLIEFLVALLIFAIGVLSLTSLQLKVLKGNVSSNNFAQAVQISYSMMDRMRSNKKEAMAGSYNISDVAEIAEGDGVAPLADDDLADWKTHELSLLPNGNVIILCSTDGNCSVTISWADSQGDPETPVLSTSVNSRI